MSLASDRRSGARGDMEAVRATNRALVIGTIRNAGAIARIEIAEQSGISPATVTLITGQLLEEGLLIPAETDEPQDVPVRGRPKSLLRLNPEAVYAIGIKLKPHQLITSLTNFLGEVVSSQSRSMKISGSHPDELAELCTQTVNAIIDEHAIQRERIAGIGIGISGFINGREGIVHWSPFFNAQNVPFREKIEYRLKLPVVIDNDVNLVGLAELWFGYGRDWRDFIVMTIEHGVGMAIVSNGELLRGSHGFAAEVGHTKIELGGALCRCGQRGCLEAYVADYAIAREASTFFAPTDLSDPIDVRSTIDKLTSAANAGDPAAIAIFERAGSIFGIGINNMVKAMNPGAVIVTGELSNSPPVFFEAMRASIQQLAMVPGLGVPEVIIHPWGDEVWAQGAAALVLETFATGR